MNNSEASKKWRSKNKFVVQAYNKQYREDWIASDPIGYRDYQRNKHLIANYGITLLQWKQLWANQQCVCVICGRVPKRPNTDHKDNFIRGILCTACNTGLGKFQDDPGLLQRAVDYLEGKLTNFITREEPIH